MLDRASVMRLYELVVPSVQVQAGCRGLEVGPHARERGNISGLLHSALARANHWHDGGRI